MKIHEIVIENSDLSEDLKSKAASWLIKKAAPYVTHDAEPVVKKAAGKATRASKGAVDPAAKTIIQQVSQGKGAIAQSALQWISVLGAAGLPIIDYNKRMNYYVSNYLATGEWTLEEYEAARRQEASVMIGKIAIGLSGAGILKTAGGLAKILVGWMPLVGKPFSALVNTLTTAGVAAAAVFLNSDTGRKWVATVFANQALADGAFDISPIIGGGTTALIDQFKELVPSFNKSAPAAVKGPSTSSIPKPKDTEYQSPQGKQAQGLPVANDKLPGAQTFDTTDKSYVGQHGRMTAAGLDWK